MSTRKQYYKVLEQALSSSNEDISKHAKELCELREKYEKKMRDRFGFMKKYSKGRSKKLNNPWAGKNKAQRNRLAGSFACFKSTNKNTYSGGV